MSTRVSWRSRSAVIAALAVAAITLPSTTAAAPTLVTPRAMARTTVPLVMQAVSFRVHNTNRSGVPCQSDGGSYVVRGHLVGPASKLVGSSPKSVSLYLHGLELGEWFWRFPAVPAYNHARQMARLGHVSVTVDRLGYDSSSQPDGSATCVGSDADVAHQIVQQLKAGTYTRVGARPVRFARVALLGHSLGGAITEVEAYSFGDVDAIGLLSYADGAFTPSVLASSLTWLPSCLNGGRRSEKGASGYEYLTTSAADFKLNFLEHSPPDVESTGARLRDLNPCGDLDSVGGAAPVSSVRVAGISVPVLLLSGSADRVFDPQRVRLHRNLFVGSGDVTLRIISGATHGLTLEPTAVAVRRVLDGWLTARGF